MKKDKYSEAKKKFFDLEARLADNYQAQRNLGWIELDEPLFDGYSCKFILRDDIARRDDADIYQFFIDKLGVPVRSRKKNFIHKDRNGRKYHLRPYFKRVSPRQYDEFPPRIQKHLHVDYDTDHMVLGRYSYRVGVPRFFFEVKRSKVYVTKVQLYDADLKKEEADLEKQLKYVTPIVKRNWRTKDRYSAPKWFRKMLHKSNKMRSKRALHNVLKGIGEGDFHFNDKDAAWLWW